MNNQNNLRVLCLHLYLVPYIIDTDFIKTVLLSLTKILLTCAHISVCSLHPCCMRVAHIPTTSRTYAGYVLHAKI